MLSRLNLLFGRPWDVVLATVIFGLFHAPTYTAGFRSDLLVGIAFSLVNPVVNGLCFATWPWSGWLSRDWPVRA